jgi:hypothetical protein
MRNAGRFPARHRTEIEQRSNKGRTLSGLVRVEFELRSPLAGNAF